MKKRLIALLIVYLAFISSPADETIFLAALSPKLKNFLTANPPALKTLIGVCSSAFRTNTVQVTYFYSEDESKPRAFHFYPYTAGMADVELCVRENQQPLDEFTCVLYELLNSKNQSRFEAAFDRAKAGSLQKREFVMAIMRIEFETDLAVRDILKGMKFTRKQKAQSHFYNAFVNCPSNFEESLTYQRKVSPEQDPIQEYEHKYDVLRQTPRAD